MSTVGISGQEVRVDALELLVNSHERSINNDKEQENQARST